MLNIKNLEQNIPDNIKKALLLCSFIADQAGISIYLIGGIVRDLIMKEQMLKQVQHDADVDITVQGNAIEFAQLLQKKYPEVCLIKETHAPFKTAKVWFDIDDELVKIDLASTRKESYPSPASLPLVEEIGCALYDDVIRRDFTINSMAMSLNSSTFGELVDYLGGYDDLMKGIIRILHPGSFIDDPTRIIRALKFSVRFGYKLDDETQSLMRECLESGRFDNLAGERVKMELKDALNINRAEVLTRLINEKIYRLVDAEIKIPENLETITKNCELIINEFKPENIWLIYLGLLEFSAEKLYLSNQEEEIILETRRLINNRNTLADSSTNFEIYEFFEKSEIGSILSFLAQNIDLRPKVELYLNELKDITLNINGNTLINMGIEQGPKIGMVLREALKAKINGEIKTPEQEIQFVNSIYKTLDFN